MPLQLPAALALARSQRYMTIGSSIATGGFGEIHIAIDKATDQKVVLKGQDAKTDAAAREFIMSTVLLQHRHDHVLAMLDSFTERDRLILVYELCETSLWCLVQRTPLMMKGCIESSRAAQYMAGPLLGLAHLHSLDIVHGDLSMCNLLVRQDSVVVISDFGSVHCCHDWAFKVEDKVTLDAMPPESFVALRSPTGSVGGGALRKSVDIWAFGTCSLTLLTGNRPWTGSVADETSDDYLLRHAPSRIAGLLGPITESSWPGPWELAGWPQFAEAFPGVFIEAKGSFRERLVRFKARSQTQRDAGDPAFECLEAVLRWDPGSRLDCASLWRLAWFAEERSRTRPGLAPSGALVPARPGAGALVPARSGNLMGANKTNPNP